MNINLIPETKIEWEKLPKSNFLDWPVKILQIKRGCVINIGKNPWALLPHKLPIIAMIFVLYFIIKNCLI